MGIHHNAQVCICVSTFNPFRINILYIFSGDYDLVGVLQENNKA